MLGPFGFHIFDSVLGWMLSSRQARFGDGSTTCLLQQKAQQDCDGYRCHPEEARMAEVRSRIVVAL
jgi:hypothetical protein